MIDFKIGEEYYLAANEQITRFLNGQQEKNFVQLLKYFTKAV
jgi:hypothetical protein